MAHQTVTLATSQTPYIYRDVGGGGTISSDGILILNQPLPASWAAIFPVLAYHHLPQDAVRDGSNAGWWIVEFFSPTQGYIIGRSDYWTPSRQPTFPK